MPEKSKGMKERSSLRTEKTWHETKQGNKRNLKGAKGGFKVRHATFLKEN